MNYVQFNTSMHELQHPNLGKCLKLNICMSFILVDFLKPEMEHERLYPVFHISFFVTHVTFLCLYDDIYVFLELYFLAQTVVFSQILLF